MNASRWTFRLRDFPQDLLVVDGLHVYGRLIGAEPVGVDRGLLPITQSLSQSFVCETKRLVTDKITTQV